MSSISHTLNRTKTQSGFTAAVTVIVIIVLIILVVLGYFAFAKSQGRWPFTTNSTGTTQTTPSVDISKLAIDNNVFAVEVTLHNVKEDGHCVMTASSKTSRFTVDDSKMEISGDAKAAFKNCTGWNVDAQNLPAGKYNVKVTFIGPTQKLTTTKTITKE